MAVPWCLQVQIPGVTVRISVPLPEASESLKEKVKSFTVSLQFQVAEVTV